MNDRCLTAGDGFGDGLAQNQLLTAKTGMAWGLQMDDMIHH